MGRDLATASSPSRPDHAITTFFLQLRDHGTDKRGVIRAGWADAGPPTDRALTCSAIRKAQHSHGAREHHFLDFLKRRFPGMRSGKRAITETGVYQNASTILVYIYISSDPTATWNAMANSPIPDDRQPPRRFLVPQCLPIPTFPLGQVGFASEKKHRTRPLARRGPRWAN